MRLGSTTSTQRASKNPTNNPSSPPPITFKVSKTSKKIMMTVFWDRTGIIYIDYLYNGKTITGAYFADVLEKLRLTYECIFS